MRIAVCLYGACRTEDCIDDIKKFILEPNNQHYIKIFYYVWDIMGERKRVDKNDNILDPRLYTDILFLDGIYQLDLNKGNTSIVKEKLLSLKLPLEFKVFDYNKYLETEMSPNVNFSKIYRKSQYFYHKPKYFLLYQLMNDIDDSFEIIFTCRNDRLNNYNDPVNKSICFDNISCIEQSLYAHAIHTCKLLNKTPDKSLSIFTILRPTGTFDFQWCFGSYLSMKKLNNLYSKYDKVIETIIEECDFTISDENIRMVYCTLYNIYVYGVVDERFKYYEKDITMKLFLEQESNIKYAAIVQSEHVK